MATLSTSQTSRPFGGGLFIDLFGIQRQTEALRPAIDERIARVMDHGQFILGPEVEELERRISEEWTGGDVVTVSSGRDALLIALLAMGIGRDDFVAVPAFTFPATAEVVTACGATPVFIDVDPDTFTIDPYHLEQKCREVPLTAVIPVDMFGLPADYRVLMKICAIYELFMLTDAAQSFGAAHRGVWGNAMAFSFYPTKPLGCWGDGGALVTFDEEMAAEYRLLRSNGIGPSGQELARGMSARLDTIQAAILLAKLDAFPDELARRREIAKIYDAKLGIVGQTIPIGNRSSHALYTVRCSSRESTKRELDEAGIASKVYYPWPLHRQPAFARYCTERLPVAEQLCTEVLSIPMHPYLTDEEVERICEAI